MADVVEYRLVRDYPGYRVGTDGSVWSCWRRGAYPIITSNWRPLKEKVLNSGYSTVGLKRPDGYHWILVHRMVLEAFVGPCPTGMQCRHFPDKDRRNNNVANLSWGTHAENMDDKRTHGTTARGSSVGTSKLTEKDVSEIRDMYSTGRFNQTEIADQYGVTQANVSEIIGLRTWKHLARVN